MTLTDFTLAAGELSFTEASAVDDLLSYGSHRKTVEVFDLGGPTREPSSRERVTLSDIGRLVAIDARLQPNDVPRLLGIGTKLSERAIAADTDLADADPGESGGVYDRMEALWNVLDGLPGIGYTKASKLLHLKWPMAFPILDMYVRDRYLEAACAAAEQYPQRRAERLYWQAIRTDLIRIRPALDEVRTALAEHGDFGAMLAGLSDLRLIDILVWTHRGRDL